MNFKIKSLALLTSIALSSVSPVEAGGDDIEEVCNDKTHYYSRFQPLVDMHDDREALCTLTPLRGQELINHYLMQLNSNAKYRAGIDAELLLATNAFQRGCLHYLKGEAILFTQRTFDLLQLSLRESSKTLSYSQKFEEENINRNSQACFRDAKAAFEEVVLEGDIETFKTLSAKKPGRIFFYVKALSYLEEANEYHRKLIEILNADIPNSVASASPHFFNKLPYFRRIESNKEGK